MKIGLNGDASYGLCQSYDQSWVNKHFKISRFWMKVMIVPNFFVLFICFDEIWRAYDELTRFLVETGQNKVTILAVPLQKLYSN
jgi:hypothetical protein